MARSLHILVKRKRLNTRTGKEDFFFPLTKVLASPQIRVPDSIFPDYIINQNGLKMLTRLMISRVSYLTKTVITVETKYHAVC